MRRLLLCVVFSTIYFFAKAQINNNCFTVSVVANSVQVGTYPNSLAWGYFNNDGYKDLVVAAHGMDYLTVLFGNGAGAFPSSTTYTNVYSPLQPATGDFNEDGKTDIAVLNGYTYDVRIFLNNAAGTGVFTQTATYASGSNPSALVTRDLNGDGHTDLAIANYNGVRILLGNGSGAFTFTTTISIGGIAGGLTTADFNMDGIPDLATNTPGSGGGLSVLYGTGTGSFTASNISTFNDSEGITSGDFNNDGFPDIAVTNYFSYQNKIFYNSGTGTFTNVLANFSGGQDIRESAVADFDSDGNLDIISTISYGGGVALNLANGGNNFNVVFFSPGDTRDVIATDLDGDNRPDFAAVDIAHHSIYVGLNKVPLVTVSPTTALCSGKTATLSSSASSYSWSTGASGSSITVSPSVTTSYSAQITASTGCIYGTARRVAVIPTPTVSVNSGSICSGQSFTVQPSGAASYTIAGGSLTVMPSGTNTYSVAGTGTNGCVSNSVAATVTVNAIPAISVNSGSICLTQVFTVNPSGAGVYSVNGTATANFTFSPSSTTSYSISGTSTAGCVSASPAVSTITVNPNQPPVISVNSGSICAGQIFTLAPSGAQTYSINGSSATVFTVAPGLSTSYSVTGTATTGCSSTNATVAAVTVYSLPVISVNSGSICSGSVFTITPSGASGYSVNGSAATVFTFNPSGNASYSLTGNSAQGCISGTPAVSSVTVLALPVISAGSGSVCSGQPFNIAPGGAASYSVNGTAATVFTVIPSSSTSYSVSGTSTAGCISAIPAVAVVTVIALPVISVNSGSICAGQVFSLSPGGASSYSVNGAATSVFTVNPSASISYSVTGTSTAGCVSSTAAVSALTVAPLPVIAVNSGSICAGQLFTVVPSGAASYSVNGSGTFTFSPSANATYSVTGTSTAGCVASNTALSQVTVAPLPVVAVGSGSICAGQVFTFVPSGASTYSLNNSSVTVFTLSPSASTIYSLSGGSSVGCVSSAPAVFSLTVHALPSLSVNSGSVCAGQVFTLIPSGAASYSVNGAAAAVFTVSPFANSSYSLTGASAEGCLSSAQAIASVTVNALPIVTAASAQSVVCAGEVVILTADGANTYAWSESGAATASISLTPSATAIYTVTGVSAAGCISTATVAQMVDPCVGLKQNAPVTGIVIYPNPTNGRFTVDAGKELEHGSVQVYTALGQLISGYGLSSGLADLDISQYGSGIYFVRVFDGGRLLKTEKIVKD